MSQPNPANGVSIQELAARQIQDYARQQQDAMMQQDALTAYRVWHECQGAIIGLQQLIQSIPQPVPPETPPAPEPPAP